MNFVNFARKIDIGIDDRIISEKGVKNLSEKVIKLELWVNFDHESNIWACVRA